MHGGRIDYTIGFNVDKSGLQKIQQSLNAVSAQRHSPTISKPIEEAALAAQKLQGILDNAFSYKANAIDMSALKTGLDQAGMSLDQFNAKIAQSGPQGQAAMAQINTGILNTRLSINNTKSSLDKFVSTFTNTLTWRIAATSISKVTTEIRNSIKYVKDLDKSLNDIQKVTGNSTREMATFTKQAQEAAAALGTTTKDYVKGSVIYARQGLKGQDITDRMNVTAKVSNITGDDTQKASEYLTSVWQGYKVKSDEVESSIDKLAAVASTSASSVDELGVAMSKVASAANTVGVPIDNLTAQIATIIQATRQAPESVGTALKTIYARMGDLKVGEGDEFGTQLGEVSSQMKQMGVDIMDSSGQMKDMGTIIDEVSTKWNGWSKAQKQAAAIAMAGKRQYNNLYALFENQDVYQRELNVSKNSEGALQSQQDVYMQSIEAGAQRLENAKQEFYSALWGDNNEISDFYELMIKLMESVTTFTQGFGGGLKSLIGLGTVLAGIFSKQLGNAWAKHMDLKGLNQRNIDTLDLKRQASSGLTEEYLNSKIYSSPKSTSSLGKGQPMSSKENAFNYGGQPMGNQYGMYGVNIGGQARLLTGEQAGQIANYQTVKDQYKEYSSIMNKLQGKDYNRMVGQIEQLGQIKQQQYENGSDLGKLESAIKFQKGKTQDLNLPNKGNQEFTYRNSNEFLQKMNSTNQETVEEAIAENQASLTALRERVQLLKDGNAKEGLSNEEVQKEIQVREQQIQNLERRESFINTKNKGDSLRTAEKGQRGLIQEEATEGARRQLNQATGQAVASTAAMVGLISSMGGNMIKAAASGQKLNKVLSQMGPMLLMMSPMIMKGVKSLKNFYSSFKAMKTINAINKQNGGFIAGTKSFQSTGTKTGVGGTGVIGSGVAFENQSLEQNITMKQAANGVTMQLTESEIELSESEANEILTSKTQTGTLNTKAVATLKAKGATEAEIAAMNEAKISQEGFNKTMSASTAIMGWVGIALMVAFTAYTLISQGIEGAAEKEAKRAEILKDEVNQQRELVESIRDVRKEYSDLARQYEATGEGAEELYNKQNDILNQLKEDNPDLDLTTLYQAQGNYGDFENALEDFEKQQSQVFLDTWESSKAKMGALAKKDLEDDDSFDDAEIDTTNTDTIVASYQKLSETQRNLSEQLKYLDPLKNEEEYERIQEELSDTSSQLGLIEKHCSDIFSAMKEKEFQESKKDFDKVKDESGFDFIEDWVNKHFANLTEEQETQITKQAQDYGMSNFNVNDKDDQWQYATKYLLENSEKLGLSNAQKQTVQSSSKIDTAIQSAISDGVQRITDKEGNKETEKYKKSTLNSEQMGTDSTGGNVKYAIDHPLSNTGLGLIAGRENVGSVEDEAKVTKVLKYNPIVALNSVISGLVTAHRTDEWTHNFANINSGNKEESDVVAEMFKKYLSENIKTLDANIKNEYGLKKGSDVEKLNKEQLQKIYNNTSYGDLFDGDEIDVSAGYYDRLLNEASETLGRKKQAEFQEKIEKLTSNKDFKEAAKLVGEDTLSRFTKEDWDELAKEENNNFDYFFTKLQETREKFKEKLKKDFLNSANIGVASQDLTQGLEKALSGELTPSQWGDEIGQTISNMETQLKEFFPELTASLDIVNNKMLIGTNAWYSALQEVQIKLEEIKASQQIETRLSQQTLTTGSEFLREITVGIDESNLIDFKQKLEELIDKDYEIDVTISTKDEQIYQTGSKILKNITDMAGKVSEGYKVAAEDVAALGKAYPGILEKATYYTDGSVKLNKEVVKSSTEATKQVIKNTYQKTIASIKADQQTIKSQVAFYKATKELLEEQLENGQVAEETKAKVTKKYNEYNSQLDASRTKAQQKNINKTQENTGKALEDTYKDYRSYYEKLLNMEASNAKVRAKNEKAALKGNTKDIQASSDLGDAYTAKSSTKQQKVKTAKAKYIDSEAYSKMSKKELRKAIADVQKQIDAGNALISQDDALIAAMTAEGEAALGAANNVGAGKNADGSKKQKEEIEKIEEERDLLKDINNQLEIQKKWLDILSVYENRSYGSGKIAVLKEENKQYQRQLKLQKTATKQYTKDVKRQGGYLKGLGAKFREDGTVSNYGALWKKYKNAADGTKTGSVARKRFDKFKEKYDAYNTAVQGRLDSKKAELEAEDKIVENNIKQLEVKLEVRVDAGELERVKLDLQKALLPSKDFVSRAKNAYKTANSYISSGELDQGVKNFEKAQRAVNKISQGKTDKIYKTNLAKANEDLKKNVKNVADNLKSMQSAVKDYFDTLKSWQDEIKNLYSEAIKANQRLIDQTQYAIDMYKLMGDDSGRTSVLTEQKAKEESLNVDIYLDEANRWFKTEEKYTKKIKKLRKTFGKNMTDAQKQEIENYESLRDNAHNNGIEAEKNAQQASLNALKDYQEAYKLAIQDWYEDTEKALTNGKGFSWADKMWEVDKARIKDFYDETERLLNVEDFNLMVKVDIDASSSDKIKKQLKEFADEQTRILENQANLTEYDFKLAKAKYEILKKEIALREAQENKNALRLRRNSQGNYTYQYVANQSQIDKAQQDLNKSRSEYYTLTKNEYINRYDQYTKSIKDAVQTMRDEAQKRGLDTSTWSDSEVGNWAQQNLGELGENLYNRVQQDNEKLNQLTQDYAEAHYMTYEYYTNKTERKWSDLADSEKQRWIEDTLPRLGTAFTQYYSNLEKQGQKWGDELVKLTNKCNSALTTYRNNYDALLSKVKTILPAVNTLLTTHSGKQGIGQVKDAWNDAKISWESYQKSISDDKISGIVTKIGKIASAIYDAKGNDGLNGAAKKAYKAVKDEIDKISNLTIPKKTLKITADTQGVKQAIKKISNELDNLRKKIKAADPDKNKRTRTTYKGKTFWTKDGKFYAKKTGGKGYSSVKKAYQATYGKSNSKGGSKKSSTLKVGQKFTSGMRKDKYNHYTSDPLALFKESKKGKIYSLNDYQSLDSFEGAGYKVEKIRGNYAYLYPTGWAQFTHLPYWYKISDLKKYYSFDTGGYTGKWNTKQGRLAMLHEKELVLNKTDTSNMLDAVTQVREIARGVDIGSLNQTLESQIAGIVQDKMSAVGVPSQDNENGKIDQKVIIQADFPNVENAKEIEKAFNSLVNTATQQMYKK